VAVGAQEVAEAEEDVAEEAPEEPGVPAAAPA